MQLDNTDSIIIFLFYDENISFFQTLDLIALNAKTSRRKKPIQTFPVEKIYLYTSTGKVFRRLEQHLGDKSSYRRNSHGAFLSEKDWYEPNVPECIGTCALMTSLIVAMFCSHNYPLTICKYSKSCLAYSLTNIPVLLLSEKHVYCLGK